MKLDFVFKMIDVEVLNELRLKRGGRSVSVVIVRLNEDVFTPCGTINHSAKSILAVFDGIVCRDDVVRGRVGVVSLVEVLPEFHEKLDSLEVLQWLRNQWSFKYECHYGLASG